MVESSSEARRTNTINTIAQKGTTARGKMPVTTKPIAKRCTINMLLTDNEFFVIIVVVL